MITSEVIIKYETSYVEARQEGASVVEMLGNVVVQQVLRCHQILSVDTILTDCLFNEWMSILVQWLYSNALLMFIEFLIN